MGPRSRISRDTSDPASLEVISPPHGRKPHEPTVWTASRRISTSTGSGLPGSATSWAASMGSAARLAPLSASGKRSCARRMIRCCAAVAAVSLMQRYRGSS